MTINDRIEQWVRREFAPQHVDKVCDDLRDVAAGNRPGNQFENEALRKIMAQEPVHYDKKKVYEHALIYIRACGPVTSTGIMGELIRQTPGIDKTNAMTATLEFVKKACENLDITLDDGDIEVRDNS